MAMYLRSQWQYPGLSRCQEMSFVLILDAFLCMAGTQVLFWTFTYPANQQTRNWSVLP
jgi:hypothetical protein